MDEPPKPTQETYAIYSGKSFRAAKTMFSNSNTDKWLGYLALLSIVIPLGYFTWWGIVYVPYREAECASKEMVYWVYLDNCSTVGYKNK